MRFISQYMAVLALATGAALCAVSMLSAGSWLAGDSMVSTTDLGVDSNKVQAGAACRVRSKARKQRNGTRCSNGQPIDPLRKIYLAVAVV